MMLQLVTPEGPKVTEDVTQVTAPGTVGVLGILPGHRALLTSLDIGVLSYTADGKVKRLAVNGGYLETVDDQVIVITETAEFADEVDVERARTALSRAEARIKDVGQDESKEVGLKFALRAQKRALTRLELAKEVKPVLPD